jgi:DNA-directed RNA polymerase specialized sigma subunit
VDALKRYNQLFGSNILDSNIDINIQCDLRVIPGDRRAQYAIVDMRMSKLPDRDRIIMVMYSEGMTSEEIAAATSETPVNVRQIIHRSILVLRGDEEYGADQRELRNAIQ